MGWCAGLLLTTQQIYESPTKFMRTRPMEQDGFVLSKRCRVLSNVDYV